MTDSRKKIKFRVLLTDRAWPDADLEREQMASIGGELLEPLAADEDSLVELARDADAIATCWAPVTERVIRSASQCRIIARLGIGLDNIDVATATALGIPVTNVSDYCVAEVADHTLALLYACARNVAFFHSRTKAGQYDLLAAPPMRRLEGLTLGLVGFGRIGQTVYQKARCLGLNVVAHSHSADNHGTGCRMVELGQLFESCDFVSLHVPLTHATYRLVSRRQLGLMKPSAHLINTSRGGVIDHEALWEALQSSRIAGAALDVFEPEPPNLSHPLLRDERVVVTPHVAFSSVESVRDLRMRASRQIVEALQGRQPANVVNAQVYD